MNLNFSQKETSDKIKKIEEIYKEFKNRIKRIEKEREDRIAVILQNIKERKRQEILEKIKNM